ncbi:MAG: hypothetical protein K2X66_14400 [Cyanobacteria bacterium]|nr:hypothetical protein [Cyanobacteriota bacterium]
MNSISVKYTLNSPRFGDRLTLQGLPQEVLDAFPKPCIRTTDFLTVVDGGSLVMITDRSLKNAPYSFYNAFLSTLDWFMDSRSGTKLQKSTRELLEKAVLKILCQGDWPGLTQKEVVKMDSYTVKVESSY